MPGQSQFVRNEQTAGHGYFFNSESKLKNILACEVLTDYVTNERALGYSYHAVNLFELFPDPDDYDADSNFLLADFTASYNLDAERNNYDVFCIYVDNANLDKLKSVFSKMV